MTPSTLILVKGLAGKKPSPQLPLMQWAQGLTALILQKKNSHFSHCLFFTIALLVCMCQRGCVTFEHIRRLFK